MVEANEAYFAQPGIQYLPRARVLSEEPLAAKLETCFEYHWRLSAVHSLLEAGVGPIPKPGPSGDALFTRPEDVLLAFDVLPQVSPAFLLARAFSNAHGAYEPAGAALRPGFLKSAQCCVVGAKVGGVGGSAGGGAGYCPVLFAFHGGSGASEPDVRAAIASGVVKRNVDMDTQWAYWNGLRDHVAMRRPYLQSQVGNPEVGHVRLTTHESSAARGPSPRRLADSRQDG